MCTAWTGLLILIFLMPISNVITAEKISAKIDLVLILPVPTDTIVLEGMKEKLIPFPDEQFETGKGKTRLSLIRPINDWEKEESVYNLTANPQQFKQILANWSSDGTVSKMYNRLAEAKKILDNDEHGARIVIAFFRDKFHDEEQSHIKDIVKELDKLNIFLYIVYIESLNISGFVQNLTFRNRTFGVSDGDIFHKIWEINLNVSEQILKDMCIDAELGCSFHEYQKKCRFSGRPYFDGEQIWQCNGTIKTLKNECRIEECEEDCDKQWPWNNTIRCNGTKCVGGREPVEPPSPSLKYCPIERHVCICENCDETGQPGTEAPDNSTGTTLAPGQTTVATKLTTQGTSETTSGQNQTTPKNEVMTSLPPNNTDSTALVRSAQSGPLKPGFIALIVVGCILVIVAIIVLAAFLGRKRGGPGRPRSHYPVASAT